ncbi:E3 SUMO-protein ligase ZBED1 [Frankliniella fusca]|uniref:E3 SUMO-protein ligase ZBED1 n=1 Tax=Frankliniella fusca TaxID=407009 RepID=A0AAE1HBU6_9NEOP|nr:E3 SUMO-protein ligase ZBED1 [Frankliniella fusca]
MDSKWNCPVVKKDSPVVKKDSPWAEGAFTGSPGCKCGTLSNHKGMASAHLITTCAYNDYLEWFTPRANQSVFPNLSLVARHYLAIAGTEASSERVASTGSNVCTPKRTNLLSEHLKELVFLHDNLKLPETH